MEGRKVGWLKRGREREKGEKKGRGRKGGKKRGGKMERKERGEEERREGRVVPVPLASGFPSTHAGQWQVPSENDGVTCEGL